MAEKTRKGNNFARCGTDLSACEMDMGLLINKRRQIPTVKDSIDKHVSRMYLLSLTCFKVTLFQDDRSYTPMLEDSKDEVSKIRKLKSQIRP